MPPKRKRASGETKDDNLHVSDQTCEAFLDSLSYSQYAAVLIEDGYETLQEIQYITIEDLIRLGVKIGHGRRILAKIQEKVSSLQIKSNEPSNSSKSNELEKEPASGAVDDAITIIVNKTFFQIKKTTKMQMLFAAFARRQGVAVTSLLFLLDGDRVDGENTPQTLELVDGDEIRCLLAQTGSIGKFGTHEKSVAIELLQANGAHLNLSPRQEEVKVKAILSSLPNAKPNSLFYSYDTEKYLSKAQRKTIIHNIDDAWEIFKNEGLTNNKDPFFVRQDSTISDFKIILTKRQLEKITQSSETANNLYSVLYRHKDGAAAKQQHNTTISVVVRRCTQIGHAIKFHTDVSIRTLQVPLNDTFVGGDLVFVTEGKICVPKRPAGSATVHGNDIAHGVTTLREGVRYSLFLLLQQNKT
jgi:small ubiquitin-related modifier